MPVFLVHLLVAALGAACLVGQAGIPAGPAVQIDGKLEAAEWSGAARLNLNRREQCVEGRDSWRDPADLSGEVAVRYDPAHLYLAAEVRDDVLLHDAGATGEDTADGVRVTLDFSAGGVAFGPADGVLHLLLLPLHEQRRWVQLVWDPVRRSYASVAGTRLTGIECGVQSAGPGQYSIELRVPFLAMVGPERPMPLQIGLGFTLLDRDVAGGPIKQMALGAPQDPRGLVALRFAGAPPLTDADDAARSLWSRLSPWLSLVWGPALAVLLLWLSLRGWSELAERQPRLRRLGRWVAAVAFGFGLLLPTFALEWRESRHVRRLDAVLGALEAGVPKMEDTLGGYAGAQRELMLLEILRGNPITKPRDFDYTHLADLAEGSFGYGPRRYPSESWEVRPYWIPLLAGRAERIDFAVPQRGRRLVVVLSLPQPPNDRTEVPSPRVRLALEAGSGGPVRALDLSFSGPRASASAFDRDRRDLVYEAIDLTDPFTALSLTVLQGDGVELVGLTLQEEAGAAVRPLDLGQPALTGIPARLRGPYPEDSGFELRTGERRVPIAGAAAEGFDRAWVIYRAQHPGVLPDDLVASTAVGEIVVQFRGGKVPARSIVLQHQRNVLFEASRNNQVQAPPPGANAALAYVWKDDAGEQRLNLVTEIELPRDQPVESLTFRSAGLYPIRFRAVVFGREREVFPTETQDSPLERADAATAQMRREFRERIASASFAIYREGRLAGASSDGVAPEMLPKGGGSAPLRRAHTRAGEARVHAGYLALSGSGWRDNALGVFVRDPDWESFSRLVHSIGLGLCLFAAPVLLLMLAEAIAAFSSLRVRLVAALTIATLAPLAVLAWLVLRVVEEGHEAQQRQRLVGVLDGVTGQLATLQRDLSLSAETWLAALVEEAQGKLAAGADVEELRRVLQQRMASQRPPEWKGGFLRLQVNPGVAAKGLRPLSLFDGDIALRGVDTPLRPEPSIYVLWGVPVLGVRRELEADVGTVSLSVARPVDGALLARLVPQANAVLCDVNGYPLAFAAAPGVGAASVQRWSARPQVMASRRQAVGAAPSDGPLVVPHRVDDDPWLGAYTVLRDLEATPRAVLGVFDANRPASLPLPVGRVTVRGFLLAVAAVLLLFAVLLSSVVTSRISRPIERLARGAQALGLGDLDVRVEATGADRHISRLTDSFNRMAQDLRGRIGDLRVLNFGMQELSSKLELRDAVATVVRLFMQHGNSDRVRLLLRDRDSGELVLHGDEPRKFDAADSALLACAEASGAFSARLLGPGKPLQALAEAAGGEMRSLIGLPLSIAGRTRGCLLLLFESATPPAENLDLLGALATQAALAMENARLYAAAVEDPYTGGYVPDYFRRRLAHEVAAAQSGGQSLAMFGIALLDGESVRTSLGSDRLARAIERLVAGVRAVVAPAPLLSRWTQGELRALVVGVDAERAAGLRQALEAGLTKLDAGLPAEWLPLRVAVVAAVFPAEAPSAEFLLRVVEQRLEASRESAAAVAPAAPIASTGALVATSAPMQQVLRTLQRVAPTDLPLLIEGETGTGKELLADLAHRWSRRHAGPLVKVHCAALPESLLQSELFGYERGAFTGAEARKLGKFELARGGTVFLDEIGEISLDVQVKLLRVLQQREIDRVGGLHPVPVDVRVVAATNRSLRELVAKGQFREDLYYRLQGMTLAVPPLRERRDEIPALVDRFCAEARDVGHSQARGVTTDVLDVLYRHQWPGNVRELRNTVLRAAVLASGEWIERSNLVGLVPGLEGAPVEPSREVRREVAEPAAVAPVAEVAEEPESDAEAEAQGRGWEKVARLFAGREVSAADYMAATGVSSRTAIRDLNRLIRQRRIERVGIRRGARYRLANSSGAAGGAPVDGIVDATS